MITFFRGDFDPPRTRRHQLQIREDVMDSEHDSSIRATKEGTFRGTPVTRPESQEMAALRTKLIGLGLTEVETLMLLPRLQPDTVAETFIEQDDVWFSPLLSGMTRDDLPDDFSYGNGAQGTIMVPAHRGTPEEEMFEVSWVVFPLGTQLTDAQLYRLQEIHEGIPPGNPEENVWRQFDVNGRDPAVYNLDGTLK